MLTLMLRLLWWWQRMAGELHALPSTPLALTGHCLHLLQVRPLLEALLLPVLLLVLLSPVQTLLWGLPQWQHWPQELGPLRPPLLQEPRPVGCRPLELVPAPQALRCLQPLRMLQ